MDGRPGCSSRTKTHLKLFCFAIMTLVGGASFAQSAELNSADRLAILYAPQLKFTRNGDPLVRVGIAENRDKIVFTPDREIRVLPEGEGGPEVILPGKTEYTVTISKAKKGSYSYSLIVARLSVDQRSKLKAVQNTWLKRGFQTDITEVGGLFAVKGKVFDSRTLLIGISGVKKKNRVQKLKRELEGKYGIRGSIHAELESYPSGTITLSGAGVRTTVKNKNTLWVTAQSGLEEKIKYRIPRIAKSYGKGFETRNYTGTLIFAPDRNGKLVGMVSLGSERLLKGVVPSEIFPSAPADALKAQSIAARNEIFAAVGVRNLADPYMLRADVMDQVYGGISREDRRTSAAVDATRGQVMFYGKKIIEAFYSSNSGGFTENNENVWDMEPLPHLRGKPDAPAKNIPTFLKDGLQKNELKRFLNASYPAYSKTSPVGSSKHYRWKKVVPIAKAVKWLKSKGRNIGQVKSIEILSRGVSGRVKRLKITGTKGSTLVERELNVRRMFGGLKSGLFTFTVLKKGNVIHSVAFSGAGFGHGVGMCQTGAAGMAATGTKYKQILKHYYSGISVKKLY